MEQASCLDHVIRGEVQHVGEEDELCVGEEDELCAGEEGKLCVEEEGKLCVGEEGKLCVGEEGKLCVEEGGKLCVGEEDELCVEEEDELCVEEEDELCVGEEDELCVEEEGKLGHTLVTCGRCLFCVCVQPKPHLPARPYRIGLTGGIASGKSNMCQELERLGATIINCDKLGEKCAQTSSRSYTASDVPSYSFYTPQNMLFIPL